MLLEKISVCFSGRIFSGFISPIIKGTRKEKETQLQWRTLAMVLKIKLELLNLKSRTGDQEKH